MAPAGKGIPAPAGMEPEWNVSLFDKGGPAACCRRASIPVFRWIGGKSYATRGVAKIFK
ncbi:hypothetical protein GCM10009429_09850 [Dyella marensis]